MNPTLKSFLRSMLPKQIEEHRIRSGPLKGYILVTSWHDYPAGVRGITESALLEWFRLNVKPAETWLDVGAHYGYTAIALSKLVGTQGRVYAFEPMVTTAGYLNRTKVLNGFTQLTIVPIGLSDGPLQVCELPAVRGMIDSTLQGSQRETIIVAALDSLGVHLGLDDGIHGVKIDVQGMELHVLRGMVEILKRHRPKLVLELHAGVDRREVLDLLLMAGYTLPGTPIDREEGGGSELYCNDHSYVFFPAGSQP